VWNAQPGGAVREHELGIGGGGNGMEGVDGTLEFGKVSDELAEAYS